MVSNNMIIHTGTAPFSGIISGILKDPLFHFSPVVNRKYVNFSMRSKVFGLPHVE